MPSPKLAPLVLSAAERASLEALSRKRTASQSLVERARVILACAEEGGAAPMTTVAARTGLSRESVRKWRSRFMVGRMDALADAPRPGAARKITDDQVEALIARTLTERGPEQGRRWSTRSMAAETGLSQSSVARIWRAYGLKPNEVQVDNLSACPDFIGKVRDLVGLYMYVSPPAPALALAVAVDEKSQIQALDVPGTTAQHHRRHRRREFPRFLELVDSAVPMDLDVHLILDNCPHRTPAIEGWLLEHPRFHLHFTPTSSGWLDLVACCFAELANRKLPKPAHGSVTELENEIREWMSEPNNNPKLFVWTKSADGVIETLSVYCE